MLKKKNLFLVLCGLLLASCVENNTSLQTSSNSSGVNTTISNSSVEVSKAHIELSVDDKYLDDVVATLTGVDSRVVLSSELDGIIYSINFHRNEKIELTAKSNTGKYDYSYLVSKTIGDSTIDEEVILDENGSGSFTLDCDGAFVTLIGTLNEDYKDDDTGNQILNYYNQLNELFCFKGDYLKSLYSWNVDVTDFKSLSNASTYIEEKLPADFNLYSKKSEDENNLWYTYTDSTDTYQIDVSLYPEDECLTAEVTLAYTTDDLVPDPNLSTGKSILDYYNEINELLSVEGVRRETFYSWYIEDSGCKTVAEAIALIAEKFISTDFTLVDEGKDGNGYYLTYADSEIESDMTYRIDVSAYLENGVVAVYVDLSYKSNASVPELDA